MWCRHPRSHRRHGRQYNCRTACRANKYGVDPVVHTVQVGRGDTLMALLLKTGIDRREAHNAIVALREVYNPRRLRPGQEVVVRISPEGGEGGGPRLMGLRLRTDYDRDVAVGRLVDDRFGSLEIKKQLALRPTRITGAIQTSLSVDADRAGVPPQVLIEFIRLFSFDVDFQRDIQPNDSFEILYERFHDARDRPVHDGEQLYAALTLTGVRLNLYRFESKKGGVEYFNEKGESAQKALMRTPVDGARLSSRFGRRRHPILGFTKLHTGVDFAAPRGTPVMAAGRGVIDYAGRNGAYGKYVRIRHNSTYSTAYGHLKRYARGIKRGQRVRQGQVIGYVGSTGRSTGPHLHYEVLRRGRRINPMKLRLPSGRKLAGKELAQFKRLRDAVDEQRRALPPAAIARKKEE